MEKDKFKVLEEYAKNNYIPIVRNKTCEFLLDTIKTNNYKNILEIGTAIGYSTNKMLTIKDTIITTIEKDEERYNLAMDNICLFNNQQRVKIINDDAMIIIKKLVKDNMKFDLIFLDGPKGQYYKYLPYLVKLLNNNGCIFSDNVLYKGKVLSTEFVPHKNRTIVVNLRKFLELLNEYNLKTKVYEIDDGFAISYVQGDKK